MTRAIVLTPQLTGTDGVSAIGRQVVAALEAQVGTALDSVEVWSLGDNELPGSLRNATRFRTAAGSRLAFAGFGIREAVSLRPRSDLLVIAVHLHLLPVTLALAGPRIVCLLLGIEAWKPLSRLERAALRRAWRVAAISQYTIDRFRAANPDLASLPVHVCHPGLSPIDQEGNDPNETNDPSETNETNDRNDTNDRNENFPNSANCPNALIVGRMSASERYKGHDELLEVWRRVRDEVPGATLVIAGGGDDRPRLVAKAEALGIAGAVRFEGIVSPQRLAALYRDAAVFVMPSAHEGFGLVYLEAMHARTPCIAARGAALEIVDDGVTGVVIDAGNRQALSRALIDLLRDPDRARRMGRAAADAAARRFSAAAFSSRLCDLLELASSRVTAAAVTDALC